MIPATPRCMAESGPAGTSELGGELTYQHHRVAGSADPSALPVNLPFLGRIAPRAGLVTVSQTFVRWIHGGPAGRSMMSNGTSSALNSEQDLASIPMAGGGLSRLAIARLERAGVPVAPLLKRVGLTPEVVADPEERLSVRSQVALLDEAAIALKDDRLGFTLARDFDPRELGLLYYVMASSQTLGDALKRVARYDYQRSPRGQISRGKQAHYQPKLLWRSTTLRETSNRILHVCCITHLPDVDGAEPRTATFLDWSLSIGRHFGNGAVCRNESGVRC